MTKNNTTYKGMRVFSPKEYNMLEHITSVWINSAKQFGFSQYKTPILEKPEIYMNKTSEEIMNQQVYSFKDRSDRDVVIRPEITPGVSVMVQELQKNQEMPPVSKIFSIGSVYRYENPQKGRTREHIQFNVDIFGTKDIWADGEIIDLAFNVFKGIGLDPKEFVVRVNDRKAMQNSLKKIGIKESSLNEIFRLLDSRDKNTKKELEDNLSKITNISLEKIDKALKNKPDSIVRLEEFLPSYITVEYDPTIVRGFDYYTGIIFEIFTKDSSVTKRSIAGGGRYDKLIESYGGSPTPAVGFGMGDVGLSLCMEKIKHSKLENRQIPFIMCVTKKEDIKKIYQKTHLIAEKIPIRFIGYVPKEKLTSQYKKYDELGFQAVVSFDGRRYTIRLLQTRKDKKTLFTRRVTKTLKKYTL